MLGGLFKKEKGQISIEVLIIMAILTIGALVAGTYYISTVNSNIKKAKSVDFDGSRAFEKTACAISQLDSINFSPIGGTYTSQQSISFNYIGSCPDINIFYTINGSIPTISSSIYNSPIIISNTTTIKAKIFANNNSISGDVYEQTYNISE